MAKYLYMGVVLAVIMAVTPVYGDTNILQNPGFENGTDGWDKYEPTIPDGETVFGADIAINPSTGSADARRTATQRPISSNEHSPPKSRIATLRPCSRAL